MKLHLSKILLRE